MGRRIERVRHTLSLLRSMLLRARPDEGAVLDAILEVADSAVTYRRRYLGTVVLQPVLDLLLTDETNPRAVVFQLVVLDGHVRHLPHGTSAPFRSPEERLVTAALTRLRLADIEQLCTSNGDGERAELKGLVDHLSAELPALSDALTSRYLSHAQTQHRLEEFF